MKQVEHTNAPPQTIIQASVFGDISSKVVFWGKKQNKTKLNWEVWLSSSIRVGSKTS